MNEHWGLPFVVCLKFWILDGAGWVNALWEERKTIGSEAHAKHQFRFWYMKHHERWGT